MNLLNILIGPITNLLERVIPDKGKREEMAHEIAVMVESNIHAQSMAQLEVNKVEAAHSSIFVAGWRPFVGWVCGFALAWNFIAYPISQWVAFLYGVKLEGMPELNAVELTTVLFGMLGLGAMRMQEKRDGVARSMIGKQRGDE